MKMNLVAPIWAVVLLAGTLSAAPAGANLPLTAKWIWQAQPDYHVYNQTIIARKVVTLKPVARATMRITADSYYRLIINDAWVNDGPCRSWPEHYQYDVLDVTSYLREGPNEIRVIARYYGVGDFHKVPQQAGLLAQLDVTSANGKTATLITDRSWDIAEARAWVRNTPKVSIQMEPAELYDARLEGPLKFTKARELFAANAGPWKDLNPRDVALLTKQPVPMKSFGGAKVVRCDALNFCLPAARLVNPGVVEANHNASCAAGMATVLETETGCTVNLQLENFKVSVDGQPLPKGPLQLAPGKHLVLAFVRNVTGHDKEKSLRFRDPKGFKLVNPVQAGYENPWCFIRFKEYAFATNDLVWHLFVREDPRISGIMDEYNQKSDAWLKSVKTREDLLASLGPRCELMPSDTMFVRDWMWQFYNRQEVGDATALVEHPAALMHNTPTPTTIRPSPDGDVELMYDLGEQNCGYYLFDLVAPAGVIVDIAGVEYLAPDGRIQHSWGNRNSLRYITKQGVNRFTSLKRRSGRYLFVTFRNLTAPVQMRGFQLIESTYPLNYLGSFSCSDARLDNIWAISTRTLKLCMEDTFTDCPLYEQTHWVGDARNESLLAYPVFDSRDIGRRCIRLTAQSLERYPFAGCQTPSGWDVLIPAWSFLWGISTWDYYWYTGDTEFLRQVYPDVIRNLKGAEKFVNEQGLFSGPFWNFFDWTPIDANHKTVTHNSMLMIGAIDAALRDAAVLNDTTHVAWLKGLRGRLAQGVNRLWDNQKQAYVDSVHADGKLSGSTSQHTSFLSLLYDIAEPAQAEAVRRNLTAPPEKMVRVGSPFAMLYLYETLEKLGQEDRIVQEIYTNYLPMLEAGATTVWESFPSGTTGSGGWPTRSHCHAWSSAPSYFLNRIVLGVKPVAPAASKVQISPRLSGLTWARGTVATVHGVISVSWKLKDPNTVEITCAAPKAIAIEFVKNSSLDGKTVVFNGRQMQ